MKQQQDQIAELLKTLNAPAPVRVDVNQPEVNAVAVRAEKVQKLAFNMRKSSRLKPFKVTAESDIKSFIKKFDEELVSLKAMVGIGDVLTNVEYIPIFRGSLDFSVIERVSQVLVKNGSTWEGITISDLIKLMKEEFSSQQTGVADVLKQFGQS
ncbi:MAG: hypothetical protein GY781_08400, partial [Gammaproteobacteria bacterium]|nr:hypothetical protein [Gammaproteobacteria bacterium]